MKESTTEGGSASAQKAQRKPITIDLAAAELGRRPGADADKSSVRAQSSASALLIFVRSTGGCGGFFFSCRFMGTAGYGSGGIPSLDEIWAGGGLGISVQNSFSRTSLPRCVGLVSPNLAPTDKNEPCDSRPARPESP